MVAILFLLALFLTPLVQAIPSFATAPALIVVGVLMAGAVTRIQWEEVSDALPALLTMLVMPNRNHGYASEPYIVRRTWDYFVEHLLGQEPPAGFEISGPDS